VFPTSRIFPKRTRASDGFVLIELIVAMIAAVIVAGAAVLMLQVSMGEAARATRGANATQRGRLALETIMGELHNSCVAPRVAPVGAGSDGSKLLVISGSGAGSAGSAPEAVSLHEITFANGTLRDTSYATTGTRPAPEWEFSKTGTTTTLATGLYSVGGTPVFQYFGYGSGIELQSAPLATPLTSASASEASAVTVTFSAVPHTAGMQGRAFVLADTATLRLSSSASGESGACA
jgi:type II secretory pathway pseudopilin PulG